MTEDDINVRTGTDKNNSDVVHHGHLQNQKDRWS